MVFEFYASQLLAFLAYFGTAIFITIAYLILYMWVTPHNEIALIKENNNAAAVAAIGSLIGFSLPLATIIEQSGTVLDCLVWGSIAIVVQIFVFYLVRLPFPKISERIEKSEIASGVWLGGASLLGGIINASCMTG